MAALTVEGTENLARAIPDVWRSTYRDALATAAAFQPSIHPCVTPLLIPGQRSMPSR